MNDVEIEVFRADPRAGKGITAAMLKDVEAFDCDAHPVPNVLGHPKSDSPAIERIKKFRVDGDRLLATIPGTAKKIWDGIRKGEIVNRSMAFFSPDHEANPTPGKLAPRHLGWLGGAAPGIPGMTPLHQIAKALSFAADSEELTIEGAPEEAVIFSASPTPVHFIFDAKPHKESTVDKTPEQIAEDARLAAERTQLETDRATFAASQKAAIETANGALVDGLVTKGLVAPANVPALKLVFNALASEDLEFAADRKRSPSIELATFLETNLKPVAPVDKTRISPTVSSPPRKATPPILRLRPARSRRRPMRK
jgi:hypothetical protein